MANEVVKQNQAAFQKAAEKTASATPATPNALVTTFKAIFLPILPALVSALLASVRSPKTNAVLRQVRDTLADADLGE